MLLWLCEVVGEGVFRWGMERREEEDECRVASILAASQTRRRPKKCVEL